MMSETRRGRSERDMSLRSLLSVQKHVEGKDVSASVPGPLVTVEPKVMMSPS